MTCLSKLSLSLTAQWICSIHTNEKGGMISNDKNEERFIQNVKLKSIMKFEKSNRSTLVKDLFPWNISGMRYDHVTHLDHQGNN